MNPLWLLRNTSQSWRHRGGALDFAKSLLWTYSGRLQPTREAREWEIGFRYPHPVGPLRLLLRGNCGADAFIHGEVFAHQYYRLPLTHEPRTILDLGSNAGLTAVYFGRVYRGAQIACVEPHPGNLRVLHRNLALNGVHATVFAAAVHPSDGRATLALNRMDYGHRIADDPPSADVPHIDVEAISIPTLLERLQWQRVGLLKVDIEGHERKVFAGACAWLERVDALCIECHGEFGSSDLARIARQHGFETPRELRGIWLLSRREMRDGRIEPPMGAAAPMSATLRPEPC